MAAAGCRSNCRACRSSIARGILPAIAVSASAAISTAWRGSPRCAATNFSVTRAAPQPLSADIVAAGFAAARFDPPRNRHRRPAVVSSPSPANCLSRLHPRLHTEPIWKRPWNPQRILRKRRRTFCRSAPRRCQTAVADAGGKQRLQRTRAAIVGAARKRDGRRRSARSHRHRRDRRRGARIAGPADGASERAGRAAAGMAGAIRSRRRAAKPGATRRCSICCRSAF